MARVFCSVFVVLAFAGSVAFAATPGQKTQMRSFQQVPSQGAIQQAMQKKEEHPGLPQAPSACRLTVRNGRRIDISWGYGVSTNDGFAIMRKTGEGGDYEVIDVINRKNLRYEDYSVSPDTTYYYCVRALNRDGYSACSPAAEAVTPPAVLPQPPSAVVATTVTGYSDELCSSYHVMVRWHDNSDNEDGFRIERRMEGETSYTKIGEVGPNETSCVPRGCIVSGTSYYRVKAYNVYGDSVSVNEGKIIRTQ